ncbi:hypothetical protein GF1_03500 [Desulfolithobacter dissulfuricans]|uniref:Uncharacterized protein n=1 Tax=Desulfolithobacter dissulfuricans TaxID=2795293 RepID=A0A915TZ68_9BACT|nr:hypothetical protein GF1_03500 [Desulfolithobacter dissulfuricans]
MSGPVVVASVSGSRYKAFSRAREKAAGDKMTGRQQIEEDSEYGYSVVGP